MDAQTKTTITQNSPKWESALVQRLKESPLFRSYQQAFFDATGLPLEIQEIDHLNLFPCARSNNDNPFCRLLNEGDKMCRLCVRTRQCLARDAMRNMRSAHCFAGLAETIVPIRQGNKTVAFLQTGQVAHRDTRSEQFDAILQTLRDSGESFTQERERSLREAWTATRLVPQKQYDGAIILLSAFALQLADLVGRIALSSCVTEPAVIIKAKNYIFNNLEEPLSLEDVAGHVHLSPYYFCKLFKQTTGMTFTEFVGRRRVEWAKRRLREPSTQVTEVAYAVGFQSLSQFNRSFLKYAGKSPTKYRKQLRTLERTSLAS